jgi:hypothetical protein
MNIYYDGMNACQLVEFDSQSETNQTLHYTNPVTYNTQHHVSALMYLVEGVTDLNNFD